MKITVQVKTKSRADKIEKTGEKDYKLWVKALPVKGRANKAVITAISGHFKVPKETVRIVSGSKSKKKITEYG